MNAAELAAVIMAVAALFGSGLTLWKNRADARSTDAHAEQTNVETSLILVRELRSQITDQTCRIDNLAARIIALEMEVKRANLYIEKLIHQLGLAQIIPVERDK